MDGLNEALPVKSVSIENMLNQRKAVIERVAQAFELLVEAQQIASNAHVGFPRFKFEDLVYGDSIVSADGIEGTMERIAQEVDRGAWAYLMNESGLRTFMDAKAREQWDEQLGVRRYRRGRNDEALPEFNLGNVRATFGMLYGQREEMFERGVIAVFKGLSWVYKTNQPQKFGKRIVIRYLRGQMSGGKWGASSLGHVNYGKSDQLDDLVRVMSVLDGKPEPDHRNGWNQRLSRAKTTADPDPEDDFMRVRCFRNGNGHVTFKRPDLVDAMNRIIAKHFPGALPAPK